MAQKEGAVRTETILEDVRSAAQRALEDLRDVARGIYPPLLADKGLAAALEALSGEIVVRSSPGSRTRVSGRAPARMVGRTT